MDISTPRISICCADIIYELRIAQVHQFYDPAKECFNNEDIALSEGGEGHVGSPFGGQTGLEKLHEARALSIYRGEF